MIRTVLPISPKVFAKFDTINRLTSKLCYYDINKVAINWIEDFLTCRKYMELNVSTVDLIIQRNVVEPILFIFY